MYCVLTTFKQSLILTLLGTNFSFCISKYISICCAEINVSFTRQVLLRDLWHDERADLAMFRGLLLPFRLVQRHADGLSPCQVLSLWCERGRVLCGRRILPRNGAVGARLVHERLVLRDERFVCRVRRLFCRLLLSSVERDAGRVSARLCVCERVDGGADRVQRGQILRHDGSFSVERVWFRLVLCCHRSFRIDRVHTRVCQVCALCVSASVAHQVESNICIFNLLWGV
jgi:hypothetical protein